MATTFKNALLESKLTINMELGGDNVAGQKAIIDDLNETLVIDSGSTPDGAYAFTDNLTMTGSEVNIDFLDALVDMEGNTITMAAQAVRAIKFKAPSTNAGNITIDSGATNALLLGGASFSWILTPGQSLLCYLESDGVVIDATHCNVGATGTNNDVLKYAVVCG